MISYPNINLDTLAPLSCLPSERKEVRKLETGTSWKEKLAQATAKGKKPIRKQLVFRYGKLVLKGLKLWYGKSELPG